MSGTSDITDADLARHWGTSRAYVSKRRKMGMPLFHSLAEADQWRAQHAPPRRRVGSRSLNNGYPTGTSASGKTLDVSVFLAPAGTDFDALMIDHTEQVPQIAFGLYQVACNSGDAAAVALAMRNWSEATGRARDAREKWLDLQERSKTLLHIDKVKDLVGQQFQALRQEILRIDTKLAQDCNPQDPPQAQKVLRAWVDAMLARLHSSEQALEGVRQA